MKAAVLIAAALALVGAAPAGPADTIWSDAIPPARFQGPALVPVAFLPAVEASEICAAAMAEPPPPGTVVIACTVSMKNRQPLVIMPHPSPLAETNYYARILTHELAHANRWPGDHPL